MRNQPLEITADILVNYFSKNQVDAADLPALINTVYNALTAIQDGPVVAEEESKMPTASQIRKSISEETLTSFIDGKSYKTLKRHLSTRGLTPHSYRVQFGLPNDYPMVAPASSQIRSNIAKAAGFGKTRTQAKTPE